MARVYIDGHAGTTGLRLAEWLAGRGDLELLDPGEARRKDPARRRELIAAADVTVLCLPDAAARESAAWAAELGARVLDASTAHRVAPDWVYGLPELAEGRRAAIAAADRVSNPGCYATACILLLRPLVDAGLLPRDAALAIHALSGYTGGGRPMIERWQDPDSGLSALPFEAPYALDRRHKHIPELMRHARLETEPQFVPAVGPFACGMRVQVPLPAALLGGADAKRVWEALDQRYRGERFVRVLELCEPAPAGERGLDPRECNDTNRIALRVVPHPSGHALLVATLDNLGKGAAGVAIQNLNLMLGAPEHEGLRA